MRYLLLCLLTAGLAWAGEVGSVKDSKGKAEIAPGGDEKALKPAQIGAAVSEGDLLRTGADGILEVRFYDDSFVKLGPDTSLVVKVKSSSPATVKTLFSKKEVVARKTLLELQRGNMRARVQKFQKKVDTFEVVTPVAVAAVRGTDFMLLHQLITRLVVFSGRVALIPLEAHQKGELALLKTVKKGKEARIEKANQSNGATISDLNNNQLKDLGNSLPLGGPTGQGPASAPDLTNQTDALQQHRTVDEKTPLDTKRQARRELPKPPDPPRH